MDLAPVVRLASRHRRPLLLTVLLVTGVLACGLIRLRVETGVLDWLPRGDPHVVAFRGLFDRLSGAVNQELLWLELDPDKARAAGVEKITDHESFLAQEELVVHLEKRVPEIRGQFGVLPLLKATRAKLPGGARRPIRCRRPPARRDFSSPVFTPSRGDSSTCFSARTREAPSCR